MSSPCERPFLPRLRKCVERYRFPTDRRIGEPGKRKGRGHRGRGGDGVGAYRIMIRSRATARRVRTYVRARRRVYAGCARITARRNPIDLSSPSMCLSNDNKLPNECVQSYSIIATTGLRLARRGGYPIKRVPLRVPPPPLLAPELESAKKSKAAVERPIACPRCEYAHLHKTRDGGGYYMCTHRVRVVTSAAAISLSLYFYRGATPTSLPRATLFPAQDRNVKLLRARARARGSTER